MLFSKQFPPKRFKDKIFYELSIHRLFIYSVVAFMVRLVISSPVGLGRMMLSNLIII